MYEVRVCDSCCFVPYLSCIRYVLCKAKQSLRQCPCLHLQDKSLVAFHDIRPAATKHLLVVPKAHIATVYDLREGPEDARLGACTHCLHLCFLSSPMCVAQSNRVTLAAIASRCIFLQISTVPEQRAESGAVEAMLHTGQSLLKELAPGAAHKFGFHYPPFNR